MSPSRSENPILVTVFEPHLAHWCPETVRLLQNAALTVHPRVTAITLHGSRDPACGYRPDSDVDMCLIVDTTGVTGCAEQAVLDPSLDRWQGAVEADLAAAYDRQSFGLSCFEHLSWDEVRCAVGGQDCLGLYKIQRGYDRFVEQGVKLHTMFPCLVIWRSASIDETF